MTIDLSNTERFPQLKWYLGLALLFLDLGVIFGGLNSLRLATVYQVPEIHQTHWTSTLFGAMSLLMLGQIYFLINEQLESKTNPSPTLIVLIGFLIGISASYLAIWMSSQTFASIFLYSIKISAIIYTLLVGYVIYQNGSMEKFNNNPSLWMHVSAVIWFFIAVVVFFGYDGIYVNELFKKAFIFGFFSHTLFGVLSSALPWMFERDPRSKFSVIRDTVMIHLAALSLLIKEYVDQTYEESFANNFTVLGLLGPVLWGLVGFLFILYVFDMIYKVGMNYSLVGLLIALIMFGFFVFDTFMNNIFPNWVTASHVHFMFLGTLVLTIVSIGLRFISGEYELSKGNGLLRIVGIGGSVFFVSAILLSFTFAGIFAENPSAVQLWYTVAGYMGFGLFGSLIVAESSIIRMVFSN